MAHRLAYHPTAHTDLQDIYRWISNKAGRDTALAYVKRVQDACWSLREFPNRGTPRDDLVPGLRTVAFERRAVIAYVVDPKIVRIVRVLRRGRDLNRAFQDD